MSVIADEPISALDGSISVSITAGFAAPPFQNRNEPYLFDSLAGAGTPSSPTPSGPTAGIGVLAGTFNEDWFERIHALPGRIDLGNVLQAQTQEVEVYNAYRRTTKTLDTILETGTTGVVLSGQPAPPLAYGPLQSRIYDVGISLEGPANIDALFEFDFLSEAPTLEVVGTRVVVFAYPCERPVTESIEWLTDIIEAYRGQEQRIAARNFPRQFYSMSYLFSDLQTVALVKNTLVGHLGRTFGVPMWHEREFLLADLSIGATVVSVDTDNADFREGETAILWRSPTDYEVVAIDTVGSGVLNLSRPTEQAHTAGVTEVYPLRVCFPSDQPGLTSRGAGVLTAELEWVSTESADLATPDGSLTLYQGSPVVADLNFIERDLQETIFAKFNLIDNEVGLLTPVLRRDLPELGSNKRWEPETKADLRATRGLLYALRGRQRTFWLPSFRQDFFLASTIGPSDTGIEVFQAGYEQFIATLSPLNHIEIVLTDGTIFRREITAVGPSGANEILTIDSNLGQTVNPGDIRRISYLVRTRLNADRIEIVHNGQGRAVISVPTAGVIQ